MGFLTFCAGKHIRVHSLSAKVGQTDLNYLIVFGRRFISFLGSSYLLELLFRSGVTSEQVDDNHSDEYTCDAATQNEGDVKITVIRMADLHLRLKNRNNAQTEDIFDPIKFLDIEIKTSSRSICHLNLFLSSS